MVLHCRAIVEKDEPHSVLDIGISYEMQQRFQNLIDAEWHTEGLWDSEFRSKVARPLSASTYIDQALRVRMHVLLQLV